MSSDKNGFALTRRAMAAIPLGLATMASLSSRKADAGPLASSPSLKERAAIDDLFTAYVWAYDCENVDSFLSLFVERDPIVVGRGVFHRGKPAIAAWFRYLTDIRKRDNVVWLHQALHHSYRRNGKNWLVYSYATHFATSVADGKNSVRSLGYFVSELEPVGNGFRFRRFSINLWDPTALPWTKPLPWDLPTTAPAG